MITFKHELAGLFFTSKNISIAQSVLVIVSIVANVDIDLIICRVGILAGYPLDGQDEVNVASSAKVNCNGRFSSIIDSSPQASLFTL